MSVHLLLANYACDHVLEPGVATPIDVPINGARDWTFLVKNVGDTHDVTAATVERSPLGGLFDTAEAFTAGIPLAPGSIVPVRGTAEPIVTLRLTLTSTAGTTVRIEGGGR